MPRTRRRGRAQAGELPGTLKRSSKEAQETFTKAHDSAVQAYGEGDQADRATYAEFKRKFEKRGDHWVPRQPGPGDLAHAPPAGSIRRGCPRHAAGTTWLGHPRFIARGGPGGGAVPAVLAGRQVLPGRS